MINMRLDKINYIVIYRVKGQRQLASDQIYGTSELALSDVVQEREKGYGLI